MLGFYSHPSIWWLLTELLSRSETQSCKVLGSGKPPTQGMGLGRAPRSIPWSQGTSLVPRSSLTPAHRAGTGWKNKDELRRAQSSRTARSFFITQRGKISSRHRGPPVAE